MKTPRYVAFEEDGFGRVFDILDQRTVACCRSLAAAWAKAAEMNEDLAVKEKFGKAPP